MTKLKLAISSNYRESDFFGENHENVNLKLADSSGFFLTGKFCFHAIAFLK
jgi:hypothetical protein